MLRLGLRVRISIILRLELRHVNDGYLVLHLECMTFVTRGWPAFLNVPYVIPDMTWLYHDPGSHVGYHNNNTEGFPYLNDVIMGISSRWLPQASAITDYVPLSTV